MKIHTYNNYKFEVICHIVHRYSYQIFCPKHPDRMVIKNSKDMFEHEQEALFAAVGHIDLLENGEK